MNYRALILGAVIFTIAQVLSWFQSNGQFLSEWAKEHPLGMSLLLGVPVSLGYIYGTTYVVEAFDGQLWPARFVGFATGILSFAFLTSHFMGENLNLKTWVLLGLSTLIIILQVFWKYE